MPTNELKPKMMKAMCKVCWTSNSKARAGMVGDSDRWGWGWEMVPGVVIHLLELCAGDAYDGRDLAVGSARRDGGEFAVARRA